MTKTLRPFGQLLREGREQAGLTQRDLAERAGIDSSYISRLERGLSSAPSREKVEALADALQITDRGDRAEFVLVAGCGTRDDLLILRDARGELGWAEGGEILQWESPGSGGFINLYYPQRVDEEGLILKLREVLRDAGDHRMKVVELTESYLKWLGKHFKER